MLLPACLSGEMSFFRRCDRVGYLYKKKANVVNLVVEQVRILIRLLHSRLITVRSFGQGCASETEYFWLSAFAVDRVGVFAARVHPLRFCRVASAVCILLS